MSGYESARATRLVATHCCICGRPLVDADSVEIGIGPTCRKGVDAETAPDWSLVSEELGKYAQLDPQDLARQVFFETAMWRVGELTRQQEAHVLDDHELSNLITHYIAATWGGPSIGHLIMAIRHMGRGYLADVLASRLYKVRVRCSERVCHVRSPYSDAFRAEMRAIGGRWDRDGKFYSVPTAKKDRLWLALKIAYPGEVGFGDKGEFKIG